MTTGVNLQLRSKCLSIEIAEGRTGRLLRATDTGDGLIIGDSDSHRETADPGRQGDLYSMLFEI